MNSIDTNIGTLDLLDFHRDKEANILYCRIIAQFKQKYGFTTEEEKKKCNCYTCKKV